MRRRHALQIAIFVGVAGCLPNQTIQAADVTATLLSSGNWDNPAIWDTVEFPNNGNGGHTYDVVAGRSVTIPAGLDVIIESFSLQAGINTTLSGSGSLTLNAPSSTSGSILSVDGLTLGGTGPFVLRDSNNFTGTLTNTGIMHWESGGVYGFGTGSTITNENLIDLLGDGLSFYNGLNITNTTGAALRRSVGTGVAEIAVAIQNDGTIDVDSGTLKVSRDFNNTGTIDIAAGAVFDLAPPGTLNVLNLDAGTQVIGDGDFRQSSGVLNINTDLSMPNLDFTGGTINSTGGSLLIGNSLLWQLGNLQGTTTIGPTASATKSGGSGSSLIGQLTNQGTLTWQSGRVNISGNLSNEGLIDLQGDSDTIGSFDTSISGGNLVNTANGIIRRSSGTGVHRVSISENHGVIEVESGQLFPGSNNVDFRTSGVIDIAAGATFEGTMTMEAGAQVIGDGFYALADQTLILEGIASIENMSMDRDIGTLNGNGHTLTVSNLQWAQGTIQDVVLGSGSNVTTSGNAFDDDRGFQGSVVNEGTIIVAGWEVGINGVGSMLTNRGVIDIQGPNPTTSAYAMRNGTLINEPGGQILRTIATDQEQIISALDNQGFVDAQSGILWVSNVVGQSGTFQASPGATLKVGLSTSHLNDGLWIADQGTLQFTSTDIEQVDAGVTLRATGVGATILGTGPANSAIRQNFGLVEVDNSASMTFSYSSRPISGFVGLQAVSINDGEVFVGNNANIDIASSGAIYNRSLLRGTGMATRVYAAGELRGEPILNIGELANVGATTIVGEVNANTTSIRAGTLTVPAGATLTSATPVSTGGLEGVEPNEFFYGGRLEVNGTVNGIVHGGGAGSEIVGTGLIRGNLQGGGTISSTSTLSVQGDFTGGGTLAAGTLDIAGSTTVTSFMTIESGTVLNGPGDVAVSSSGSLTVNNTLPRNVVVTGGHIGGGGTVDGTVSVHDGSLSGDGVLSIDGDLAITGVSTVTSGEVSVTGNTTVNSTLSIAPGATFDGLAVVTGNSGDLNVDGTLNAIVEINGSTLSGDGVLNDNVVLNDALLKSGPLGSLAINADVTAMGTTTIGDSCLPGDASCMGSNLVDINGSTIIPGGQTLIISEDTTLGGSGPLVPQTNSTLINNGVSNKGLQPGPGTINLEGDFPSLDADSPFTIKIEKTRLGFPIVRIRSNVTIESTDGTGTPASSNIEIDDASVAPDSTLQITTTDDAFVGKLQVDGSILPNTGGGCLVTSQASGSGSLGICTTSSNLSAGNSPGRLTFSNPAADALTLALRDNAGNPTPMPTVVFEINDATGQIGMNPGWDALMVTQGGVTIDTTESFDFEIEVLSLGLDDQNGPLANFDPLQSYTWRFIDTALGFFGTPIAQLNFVIDDIQFAFENGVVPGSFSVVQDSPTSLALQYDFVALLLPGDFNGDGEVSLADYTVWRDSLGTTGLAAFSGADGNGDGSVTMADYDVWKSNFGQSASAALRAYTAAAGPSQVPEPSALTLVFLMALVTRVSSATHHTDPTK